MSDQKILRDRMTALCVTTIRRHTSICVRICFTILFDECDKHSNEDENKEQEIEIYFNNLNHNTSRQPAQQDNAIVSSTEDENSELFYETEIEDNEESLNDPNETHKADMNVEASLNVPEE
ncbi:hypothetical protein K1T71_003953 [Dendrolimus kikuchii]|uniref:Uncharacterized protein n=1 Tax=Dendrolimus kikuchii TaxID=765133 RepID=A0ACC1D9V4_9NEOP|nr:hypothetical protein K1T71_003953 [Dendrolimus kikuchii]